MEIDVFIIFHKNTQEDLNKHIQENKDGAQQPRKPIEAKDFIDKHLELKQCEIMMESIKKPQINIGAYVLADA